MRWGNAPCDAPLDVEADARLLREVLPLARLKKKHPVRMMWKSETAQARFALHHLADDLRLERGLARPTIQTPQAIAERLEAKLLDLVTFPDEDERAKLVDRTRHMSTAEIRRLMKQSRVGASKAKAAAR